MDDLISKQVALDALNHELRCGAVIDQCGLEAAYEVIEGLPPAEPKRGKWILDRSGAYCCSKCMEPCATYVMMKPRDRFCKMCGAKMEVTE